MNLCSVKNAAISLAREMLLRKMRSSCSSENPVTTEDNGVNQNNQQFTQPVNFDNNANVTEGVQQAAQPYQVQSQPKVKKPFPTKLVVICGAAAVVIAGIIITLCTLIPYLNRIKLDDYIKVEFDKGSLYNGYASADIYIDSDTIEKKRFLMIRNQTLITASMPTIFQRATGKVFSAMQ